MPPNFFSCYRHVFHFGVFQIVSIATDVLTTIMLMLTFTVMMDTMTMNKQLQVILLCLLNVLPNLFQTCEAFASLYRRWKHGPLLAALSRPNPTQLMSLQDNDASCPICFDTMTTSLDAPRALVATPCGHIFHRACLSEWAVIQHSCPKCRHRLTDE